MTVSSTTRKAGPFAGNGVTTTFPFGFKIFAASDLALTLTNASGATTDLVLDSDYSVTINTDQNGSPGGTITYPRVGSTAAPLPGGSTLIAVGDLPYMQPTDITNGGGFYPKIIEDMSDRSTIQIQQLAELAARTLHFAVTEENVSGEFAGASSRAGTMFGFDPLGNPTYLPIPASVGAGDMRDEIGSDGKVGLVVGTDIAVGATVIALSRAPGTKANVWLQFDAAYQGGDQILSVVGNVLTLTSPVPFGIQRVYIRTGTVLSTQVPPDGSVTTGKLADGAVVLSKMAVGSVGTTNLVDGAATLAKLAAQSVDDSKVTTTSKLYHRINDVVFATDPPFNAVGNGATDNTVALNAALAYCAANGKTLFVPAGTYLCNSQLSATGPIQMEGEGVNKTTFLFPTNQGMLFTIPDQWHSVHLRDFTVLGSLNNGTGNAAIKLVSAQAIIANAADTQVSDIVNVNVFGTDGPSNFDYWACCIEIQYTSNVNLLNVMLTGSNTFQGTGVWVHGDVNRPPNVFNFTCLTCNYLNVGVQYGDYVQGVTVQQSNFLGCNFGISTIAGLHILVQLAVNCSQFNCFNTAISLATEIPDLLINGNLFLIPGPATGTAIGVNLIRGHRGSITGNSFTGYNTTTNADGIVVGTSAAPLAIGLNSFNALNFGVILQAASANNNVQSNIYSSVGTAVSNSGTGNTVGGGSH